MAMNIILHLKFFNPSTVFNWVKTLDKIRSCVHEPLNNLNSQNWHFVQTNLWIGLNDISHQKSEHQCSWHYDNDTH